MAEQIEKECKNHGLTTHTLMSFGKKGYRPVCKLCKTINERNRIRENKLKLVAYKGGKCSICGYNKSMSALHFHHNDPTTKSFAISEKSWYGYARLVEEADKCSLLCANCHSEKHDEELTYTILPKQKRSTSTLLQ